MLSSDAEIFRQYLQIYNRYSSADDLAQGFQSLTENIEPKRRNVWTDILAAINMGLHKKYDAALVLFDTVLTEYPGKVLGELCTAFTMRQKGMIYEKQTNIKAAIDTYNAIIMDFGKCADIGVCEQVASAMFNKASVFEHSGDITNEILVYDDIIEKYKGSSESSKLGYAVKAMLFKGFVLGHSESGEKAIAIYDDIINKYEKRTEANILEQVVKAMRYKGFLLKQGGDDTAEIPIYDAIIQNFGERDEPEIREQVATAMLYKSNALGQRGEAERAIRSCDDLIRNFGERKEPNIIEQVVKAMCYKGRAFESRGDTEAALQIYGEVVHKFEKRSEPHILAQVAGAKLCIGVILQQRGKENQARKIFIELADSLKEHELPTVQYIAVQAFFKMKKHEEALSLITKIIFTKENTYLNKTFWKDLRNLQDTIRRDFDTEEKINREEAVDQGKRWRDDSFDNERGAIEFRRFVWTEYLQKNRNGNIDDKSNIDGQIWNIYLADVDDLFSFLVDIYREKFNLVWRGAITDYPLLPSIYRSDRRTSDVQKHFKRYSFALRGINEAQDVIQQDWNCLNGKISEAEMAQLSFGAFQFWLVRSAYYSSEA